MTYVNLNDINEFNDQSISRRVVSEDPLTRVVLVSLRKGQGLPDHPTEGLITIYTLSGSADFTYNGESVELKAGVLVRLAPGRQHRLQAKEDTRLLVQLVRPGDAATWSSLAPRDQELDLRPMPHARRHSTIFYAFDQLAVGESFYLLNDHDPQPLHWQMDEARPGQLQWEYTERGPERFRIRLTRIAAAAPAHA